MTFARQKSILPAMQIDDFRPILLVNGILLSIVSILMLLPALVDYSVSNPDWKVFLTSSIVTGFIGIALYLTNQGHRNTLTLRQTFLFTITSYFVVAFFCAIPLYLADLGMPFVDAAFEAVSGITSTGASVMSGLDYAPPGILLWRSLLNAMGGIGIVVLTLAILPMLRIGGMQLFRTESSDKIEKMLPRTTQLAAVISSIFFSLCLLCAFLYWLAGMNGFDAICHALTTTATGGFSTHDRSIGFYNSPLIEGIAVVFMISGALPLMLYYKLVRGDLGALSSDPQVKAFLSVIVVTTAMLTLWLILTEQMNPVSAVRYTLFNVVSIITTTGYASTDYSLWGPFAITIFFMLTVFGGCTGSTTGGIKMFRFLILYQTARAQIQQLIQPHGVFIPRYHNKPVPDAVSASVMSFFLLFASSFMVVTIILSAFGLDFLTSMSASAQALANVGPGLGEIVGPSGNYEPFPVMAKWVLAFAMIMGRLELFTVVVIFTVRFWKD